MYVGPLPRLDRLIVDSEEPGSDGTLASAPEVGTFALVRAGSVASHYSPETGITHHIAI
jgi:hypothetical protein